MSKISLASLDWNLKIEKFLKIEPPLIFTQFFRNGGVENDDSATKKADRKKFSRWVKNPLGGVLAIFITIKPLYKTSQYYFSGRDEEDGEVDEDDEDKDDNKNRKKVSIHLFFVIFMLFSR